MESTVSFLNNDGLRLVGIHHAPDEKPNNVGILFIHSGTQGRLGNTNQYVYYAREFSRQGYPCMRFDPNGLGDSGGLVGEIDRRDFFGSIQTGRYVADVYSAINEFKRIGIDKILLFGVCGGAISALLAGSYSKDICGMILMSCPVVLDGAGVDYDLRIPTELARKEILVYVKKLLNISAIWRFITFKSEYHRILSRLKASVNTNKTEVSVDSSDENTGVIKSIYNKYFFEAYARCNNKKILWIYGSNDQFWFEFQKAALGKLNIGTSDELHLVQNGNHMFTLPEWQHEICAVSLNWIERQSY